MPHEPGLFVDKESFEEHKLLWEEAGIEDYSYTYSYDNDGYPKENYVVDVVVSGGKVESFILKEYCGESLADKSMNEWESEAKQFYENTERDSSFLLIDKVFEMIDSSIKSSERMIVKYPKSYYSKFVFDFSDKGPFLNTYIEDSAFMSPTSGGGGGCLVLKMENFNEK